MSDVIVRPFRRTDRDQLTGLINQHIGAVMPGCSVSVNAVLSQLEREPDEVIVDPWVAHREIWVAEQRESIVAAALLHSFAADDRVSDELRNRAEIRWLVALPSGPTGDQDSYPSAAAEFVAQLVQVMRGWHPSQIGADPKLPAPGVYGVPEVWPHIEQLLRGEGFQPRRTELVCLADVADLHSTHANLSGLALRREVGALSTRFVAELDRVTVGFIEVNSDLTVGGLRSQFAGIADIDNVWVDPDYRRQGVATWLLGEMGQWLKLGRIDRVLNYADADDPEQEGYRCWMQSRGWRVLTRTRRGWTLG